MRPRLIRAGKGDLADHRRATQPHEIILEVEPALRGAQPSAHPVVAHRQKPRRDPEAPAEIIGDLRQALAGGEPPRALDMGREIAVAEVEPGLAAEASQRLHKGPGLVAPAPAELRIVEAGEGVEQGVDIGRDREPQMLEIVAGIGDDGQRAGRQDAIEAERQLGAADPARQRKHKTLRPAHRKRSCSTGRTKAAAGMVRRGPGEAAHQHDRYRLVGLTHQQPRGGGDLVGKAGFGHQQFPSEKVRVAAQIDECRQSRGTDRHADRALAPRPAKAVADDDADADCRRRPSDAAARLAAEPSGSTGSSSTRSPPSLAATFEWSMPALAMTKPRRCSTISRPGRWRTTRFDFGQHHLDKARVLVDLGGECDRALRRPHGRDIDITSFGLGDDLLRHDQYIAVFRDNAIVPQRGDGNRTEIVARLDQLDAGQRGESDLPGHHPSLARSNGNTCSA